MNRLMLCAAGFVVTAGLSLGAEKGVMHCFAYTPIEAASQSDWAAFQKATDALPGKIKGLRRVWAGKLMRPLNVPALASQDAELRKKINAEGKGTTDVTINRRQYGVCMEFEDEAAFKAYGTDSAHKDWVAAYSKVRVEGTTTYQIVSQ